MTITFPSSRNSFHPAWLLLLVPPVASLTVIWWHQNPPEFLGQVIRLSLTLLLVGPLIWLRSGPVGGRTQRLLKEVRALLPGGLIALLVPGLLGLYGEREIAGFAVWSYGFGCLLMGASAFGSEFEQRTMGALLGQPLSRGVVFAEKVGVLGLLLLLATVNVLLSLSLLPAYAYGPDETAELLLLPAFALCSGPLFSLISRSTLASLVFTVTMPMIAYSFGVLGLELVHRFGHPGETLPDEWVERLMWIGTPLYLLATAALGWRAFRNFEVRDSGAGGRSGTPLHPLSWPVDAALRRLFPSMGGTALLVRKEFRLHAVPWLVASIMVGLWLVWLALRHFARDEDFRGALNQVAALTVFAGLLGTLLVVVAGAASVAEERELGTLEWQLTQPVSVRRQWWVKVAVTMALGLVLGLLLPALLLWLGFSPEQLASEVGDKAGLAVAVVAALFLVGSAISIYASSISRNTMKATATAAGIASGFTGVVILVGGAATATMDGVISGQLEKWATTDVNMPVWAPSQSGLELLGIGFVAALVLVFTAALLKLGERNYRRQVVSTRDISRQLAGVTLGLLAVMGLFAAVFSQLVLVRLQANAVETREERRRNDFLLVRSMVTSGKVTPEVYQRFGLPTNATPESLTEAIIAAQGPNAVYELSRLLNPPTKGKGVFMDSTLARRYGLVPQAGSTSNTNASTPQLPAVGAPKAFTMDPVLARRYGLIPQTNPPAAGTPAPAVPGK